MSEPDRRHTFTITVNLHRHGANYSDDLAPVLVKAFDLPAALRTAAEMPLSAWFPEDEVRVTVARDLRKRMRDYGATEATLDELFAGEGEP